MARKVVRKLFAFDAGSVAIPLDPGAMLHACSICRKSPASGTPPGDVYFMEFDFEGRRLRCPLVDFQARTQITSPLRVEPAPAREPAGI